MIEIGIPLIVSVVMTGLALVVWRALRGPTRGRIGGVARVAVASLVSVSLVTLAVYRLSKSRHVQLCGNMVTRVQTSEPVVALTFDDGPLPGYTEEILETLRAEGVRATFFVTGGALEEHPSEGRRLVASGHELGNHSYSHRRMMGMTYAMVRQEIERTDDLIRAAGYEGQIHVRPPYGKRFIVLPYYLWVTDRTTVYWDVEPESYREIAGKSERIEQHVLEEVRPGSIILLHVMGESRGETRRAVPGIIRGLLDRGYSFVTVSELLAYSQSGGDPQD